MTRPPWRHVARQEVPETTDPTAAVTFGTEEVEAALDSAAGLVDTTVQGVLDDFGQTADALSAQITALLEAIQTAADTSVGEIQPVLQKLLQAAQAITGTTPGRHVARQEVTEPAEDVAFSAAEVENALGAAAALVDGTVDQVFDDFGETAETLSEQISALIAAIEGAADSSIAEIEPACGSAGECC